MRKLLMGEAWCRVSQVRYYLLEEDSEEPVAYGVQVELEGEEASVMNLSPSRQKVEALAKSMILGAVTPVAVRDVVDDWLLE